MKANTPTHTTDALSAFLVGCSPSLPPSLPSVLSAASLLPFLGANLSCSFLHKSWPLSSLFPLCRMRWSWMTTTSRFDQRSDGALVREICLCVKLCVYSCLALRRRIAIGWAVGS